MEHMGDISDVFEIVYGEKLLSWMIYQKMHTPVCKMMVVQACVEVE